MMKHLKWLLALLSAYILPSFAFATTYEVELVIFSHITATNLNSENWPILGAPVFQFDNVVKLKSLPQDQLNKASIPSNYTILPSYDFNLNRSVERLIQSPDYKVLLHLAWRQPAKDKHDAKWIHIYGGQGYDDSGNVVIQNFDGLTAYDAAKHWQVDGLVKFDVDRYFNSRYQLGFAAPAGTIQNLSTNQNFSGDDSPLIYFNLDQSRRMKSKELNYIGHPLYGILVYITPINSDME